MLYPLYVALQKIKSRIIFLLAEASQKNNSEIFVLKLVFAYCDRRTIGTTVKFF